MASYDNPPPQDPYTDATYRAPAPTLDDVPRGRSRSRSPPRGSARDDFRRSRSPYRRRSPPPPPRRSGAPIPTAPTPSNVLGIFGLSIRTQERDLDDEFSRFGRVEKVTIVYDQRSDRSRGFGFIKMSTVEEATRCIQELNGVELNGRRIRVDYSVTDRPHAPTPGEYMGHRRAIRDQDHYRGRDSYRDSRDYRDYRDRDRDSYRDRDYRRDNKDPYGREPNWRDRRTPPRESRGRYSPERRRRSYSRSPPRGAINSSPRRDYDAPPPSAAPPAEARW
ncbi:RRM domain-containing protein [Mycena kentingensis (nom. inval.)]|nr:RRM domain-containing protein [Mycena kentingensis (nom. inval.)]